MGSIKLVVIDYGAGNLRSVGNALRRVGCEPLVSEHPADLGHADAVILPGVGAAGDAMRSLARLGLIEPIRRYVASGRPFLGVCLGMQVMLTVSEEGGEQPCLDLVPGRVRLLPPGLKVPHMGWNQVRFSRSHPLLRDIPDGSNFYFVHSYYCEPQSADAVLATTDYGITFCSVLAQDNLYATQFHPEKSGDLGIQIYRNFLELVQA